MILEGAIGDAYGAGFEFASEDIVREKNNLTAYIPHPKVPSIYKRYTDDTQMALAIAELIVECVDWTPENIADKFVKVYHRDPRGGYATKFQSLLTTVRTGPELIKAINADSIRNGAAMRAYPIGVLTNLSEVKQKAFIQASVTHNTKEGILSAQAIALMSHYTYHNIGELRHLPEFLHQHLQSHWEPNWRGRVEIDAMQTVHAVLSMICNHSGSLSQMLIDSVNLTGDVDTVASLALAIGSSSAEIVHDLPEWLFVEIEDGEFGMSYLRKLDDRLFGN